MKANQITIKVSRTAQRLLQQVAAQTRERQYVLLERILGQELSHVRGTYAMQAGRPLTPYEENYTIARLLHYLYAKAQMVLASPEQIDAAWDSNDNYGRKLWIERADTFRRCMLALQGTAVLNASDIEAALDRAVDSL
jgi:hypothetical protein